MNQIRHIFIGAALCALGTLQALAAGDGSINFCDFSAIKPSGGACPVGYFLKTTFECRKKVEWNKVKDCECDAQKNDMVVALEARVMNLMEEHMKREKVCIPALATYFYKNGSGSIGTPTEIKLASYAGSNQIFNMNDCGSPGDVIPVKETTLDIYNKKPGGPYNIKMKYAFYSGNRLNINAPLQMASVSADSHGRCTTEAPNAYFRKGSLSYSFKSDSSAQLEKITVNLEAGKTTGTDEETGLETQVWDPSSQHGQLERSLIQGEWVMALGKALGEVKKEISEGKIKSIHPDCVKHSDALAAAAQTEIDSGLAEILKKTTFQGKTITCTDPRFDIDWIDKASNVPNVFDGATDRHLMDASLIATIMVDRSKNFRELAYCEVLQRADTAFTANYLSGDWNKLFNDKLTNAANNTNHAVSSFENALGDDSNQLRDHCRGAAGDDRDSNFGKRLKDWRPCYERIKTYGQVGKKKTCYKRAIDTYYPYAAMSTFFFIPDDASPAHEFLHLNIKTERHMKVIRTPAEGEGE